MNTSIFAAGEAVDIGCKVVKWDEPNGFSFYNSGKFIKRDVNLEQLQKQIKALVFHHTVDYRARITYSTLIARGLSVNFIVDDDINEDGHATIYQCLDIKDGGYSQKTPSYTGCPQNYFNTFGAGIEICLNPVAFQKPDLYSETNQQKYHVTPHTVIDERVHGAAFKVFAVTEAQMKSLAKLTNGYLQLFPNVPGKFPRDAVGNYNKLYMKDLLSFTGLINHYNLDKDKVDCMGLDLKAIEDYCTEQTEFRTKYLFMPDTI
jgi:hypothetical protein